MKNGTLLTVVALATAAGVGYMIYKQKKKKCGCGCQDKPVVPAATDASQPIAATAAALAMDGFKK